MAASFLIPCALRAVGRRIAAPDLGASGNDVDDLERGEGLAMPRLAPVVLAAPELEDDELGPEALAHDLRLDLGPADERLAELHGVAPDEEDLVEGDRVADAAGELLDPELVALRDPVLLSTRLEHRVHVLAPAWNAAPGERAAAGVLGAA